MDYISKVQIGCPMFTYDTFKISSKAAFFSILFAITDWEVAEHWPKLLLKSERKD